MTRRTSGPELRSFLPALLLAEPGDDETRRVRRSPRDWFVDVLCFLIAVGVWLVAFVELNEELEDARPLALIDMAVGAIAVPAVWLRRRWPLGLAAAMIPLGAFFGSVGGTAIISLFTVAVHRRPAVSLSVAAGNIVVGLIYVQLRPTDLNRPAETVITVLGALVVLAWGMFVRARRQLVVSLRERAVHAESEAHLRVEQARHLERERIAREMHDVLAHRLSLLSVHAGALEYRPDAPADDVARAAGIIRTSAHQALQDLREVIGVLRAPSSDDPGRPQPSLHDLPQLLDESRAAGMRVDLIDRLTGELTAELTGELADKAGGLDGLPLVVGRCAYRVVQEALTNARKHAPGRPVTVTLDGTPGQELRVEVRNRATLAFGGAGAAPVPTAIPGTGTGLIGLRERVTLVGGHLEHGRTAIGDFVLEARLPWEQPASATVLP